MAIIKYGHRDLDVACRLDVAEGRDRLTAWRLLRGEEGLGSEQLPNGVRIWLRPGARGRASELARQEARCCGFLDLELASDGDRLYLDVTSPAPEAAPLIARIGGGVGR
jgi:hypothetical protein